MVNNNVASASNPGVSVVVCSYNQGKFLEDALVSVLSQDYPQVELIVIDGGSTDESLAIIERYQDRIAYWISEPDRGQSHALNKGFARAKGDLRGFLNSDDILLPGAISNVVEVFKRTRANFVYGDHLYMDVRGRLMGWETLPRIPPHALMLYGNRGLYSESCFWTAELHRATGEFDEHLQHAVDGDWFLRMTGLPDCHPVYVKIPMGCPRVHAGQKTALLMQEGDNLGKQHSLLWRRQYITRNRVSTLRLLGGSLYYGARIRLHEALVMDRGTRYLVHLPHWKTVLKLLGRRTSWD